MAICEAALLLAEHRANFASVSIYRGVKPRVLSKNAATHSLLADLHEVDLSCHSFGAAVRALAASRSGIRCVTLYETIGPDDVQGKHFDAAGRISVELIRTHLPAGNAEFYYCGPIGFMAATERVLDELGVPVQRRHSEAFAPDASFGVNSPSIDG
jgi:hypothetical protein